MCLVSYSMPAATSVLVMKVAFFKRKKQEKKVHFDRIAVGERAALGCRNPRPTPGFQRAYKLMTSRKGERW
jgi:hypothetical protein